MAASNKNTPPGMVPPSNVRKVLTPTQVSDAGAAAQKSQPPQLPTLKQAQIEEMMNPQHRPLTQELVQMAMAKTAERVALLEESDRQRGLPATTTKVASDEADESIGTDFAEKLASAVEFILPEVQAKEAGALESIGNAVRKGGGALAEKGIDVGWTHGRLGKAMQAVGERAGNVTNSQIGSGLKGTAMVAGGALAGAGATKALSHKEAGVRIDKAVAGAKNVAKSVGAKLRGAVAKKEGPATLKEFQGAKTISGAATKQPIKDDRGMPSALKSNAQKVKDAFSGAKDKAKDKVKEVASKGEEKARNAAVSFGKAFGGKEVDRLKSVRDKGGYPRMGRGSAGAEKARKALSSDLLKERVKTHGARGAVGVAAAGAAGGAALAGKKIHDKATEKKAGEKVAILGQVVAGVMGHSAGKEHGQGGRGAAGAIGGSLGGGMLGHVVGGISGDIAGQVAGGIIGYELAMQGHKKQQKKHAEDAINPAHISGKASPLAAAPVRTETGQAGPSAQGNTGALSSNAAAIAFSNAKNQGMKAEQLRKYFSNPASSQHGDPALTKNFAHKTASDKVVEAQHILSALAAQVEGK